MAIKMCLNRVSLSSKPKRGNDACVDFMFEAMQRTVARFVALRDDFFLVDIRTGSSDAEQLVDLATLLIEHSYVERCEQRLSTKRPSLSQTVQVNKVAKHSADSRAVAKRFKETEEPLKPREVATVTVCCVETTFEFYVKREGELAVKFRSFLEAMQLFYATKTNLPEPTLRINEACVYNEGRQPIATWHRAKIVYVHDANHVIVHLVDSGETHYVNRASLREIADKFLTLGGQASLAAMSDICEKRHFPIDEELHQ